VHYQQVGQYVFFLNINLCIYLFKIYLPSGPSRRRREDIIC
jgi:hypothetical protein